AEQAIESYLDDSMLRRLILAVIWMQAFSVALPDTDLELEQWESFLEVPLEGDADQSRKELFPNLSTYLTDSGIHGSQMLAREVLEWIDAAEWPIDSLRSEFQADVSRT